MMPLSRVRYFSLTSAIRHIFWFESELSVLTFALKDIGMLPLSLVHQSLLANAFELILRLPSKYSVFTLTLGHQCQCDISYYFANVECWHSCHNHFIWATYENQQMASSNYLRSPSGWRSPWSLNTCYNKQTLALISNGMSTKYWLIGQKIHYY